MSLWLHIFLRYSKKCLWTYWSLLRPASLLITILLNSGVQTLRGWNSNFPRPIDSSLSVSVSYLFYPPIITPPFRFHIFVHSETHPNLSLSLSITSRALQRGSSDKLNLDEYVLNRPLNTCTMNAVVPCSSATDLYLAGTFPNLDLKADIPEYYVSWIFRRVRKIAKSDYYLRLICPSVRMEQIGSHWMDFHEI